MGHRERRARDEQQLRRGILGFGVWIRAVLMALTLVREYFASGLSARIFVASFLGRVVANAVRGIPRRGGCITVRHSPGIAPSSNYQTPIPVNPFLPIFVAVLFLLGACAPPVARPGPTPAPVAGLPPVPHVEGPMNIRVQYPSAGTLRPSVDSTFIFGFVGNGRATLTINGAPVQRLAPNGAFLAYLPVPANGVWVAARPSESSMMTRSRCAPRREAGYTTAAASLTPNQSTLLCYRREESIYLC
jgi:hypothetical protein